MGTNKNDDGFCPSIFMELAFDKEVESSLPERGMFFALGLVELVTVTPVRWFFETFDIDPGEPCDPSDPFDPINQ